MEEHTEPLAPQCARGQQLGVGEGDAAGPPQPRCSGSTSRLGDPPGESGRGEGARGRRRHKAGSRGGRASGGHQGRGRLAGGPGSRGRGHGARPGKGGSGDAGSAWERADPGMHSSGGRGLAEAGAGAAGLRVAGGPWGPSSPSLPPPGGGARRSGRGLCAGAGARSRGPRRVGGASWVAGGRGRANLTSGEPSAGRDWARVGESARAQPMGGGGAGGGGRARRTRARGRGGAGRPQPGRRPRACPTPARPAPPPGSHVTAPPPSARLASPPARRASAARPQPRPPRERRGPAPWPSGAAWAWPARPLRSTRRCP